MSVKIKSFPSFILMIICAWGGFIVMYMYANSEELSEYSFPIIVAGLMYAYCAYMMVINTRWLLRKRGKNPKAFFVSISYGFLFMFLFLLAFEASEDPESIVMRMPGTLIGNFILFNFSGFFICMILTLESGFRGLWNDYRTFKTEGFRYKGPCPYCSSIVHVIYPVQACPYCKGFSIIQQNHKLIPVSEIASKIVKEDWMD